jgi:hypothetical protein
MGVVTGTRITVCLRYTNVIGVHVSENIVTKKILGVVHWFFDMPLIFFCSL